MDRHIAWEIGWRQSRAVLRMGGIVWLLCGLPLLVLTVLPLLVSAAVKPDVFLSDIAPISLALGWPLFLAPLLLAWLLFAVLNGVGLGLWMGLSRTSVDPFTLRDHLRWRAFALNLLLILGAVALLGMVQGQRLYDIALLVYALSGAALLLSVLAVAAVDDVADWYNREVPLRKKKRG